MPNYIGSPSGSFVKRIYSQQTAKSPHYEDTYIGLSQSLAVIQTDYYNKGWKVEVTPGNPYTLVATVDLPLNSDNSPFTGSTPTGSNSSVQTNWFFHSDTATKDLLHVGQRGVLNGVYNWLNDISMHDKNALEYLIANPPTTASAQGITVPIPINWNYSDTASPFSGSNSTSVSAAKVVWAMTKNGQKTIDIKVPVLRMTKTVPLGYNLTLYTGNCETIYYASTLWNVYGIPDSYYYAMRQDSDPASGTVTTDDGTNLPLHYGWKKNTPEIQQNGSLVNITLDFTYGLYFQNTYGSPS